MSASPFAQGPAILAALVPELSETPAGEPRADCARCPMAAESAPPPWRFTSAAHCCTYHPFLASFRAGAALARGGIGAERVRARIDDAVEVGALGIAPPRTFVEHQRDPRGHGQAGSPHCPFWVGGDHACGVWHDRPPTCRGWFCKHDDGLGGAVDWSRTAVLAGEVELIVARRLAELGAPPAPGAPADAWCDWYRWCATRVETLDDGEVARLRAQLPSAARDELVRIRRRPARALADVVVPAVTDLHHGGDRVLLTGYSTYDAAAAPPEIFAFLARLDGDTPWRDALAASSAVNETTVRELHRVGALRAVDGSDDLPFSVEPLPPSWTALVDGVTDPAKPRP
jgi:hypothetical protein